ncbi:hypothetical protein HMI54_003937 [Coelomomyces lativittatus]|nr:hypothetical protein HMI56_000852 [Coelomomyces lativittatus]KAJ1507686.1 hypothetical protein HMI54_003937 [Coelomomyces lativittatus]
MGMDTDHLSTANPKEIIELVSNNHEFQVYKEELVRLILDELRALNYLSTVATLEKESGIALESNTVTQFRQALCKGQWGLVDQLLPCLLISKEHLNKVVFAVHEQHYLELLVEGDLQPALQLLRDTLTPIHSNSNQLRQLSSYLMCTKPEEIKSMHPSLNQNVILQRYNVLKQIQQFIPPEIMLPERRLEALIDQALSHQIQKCTYHNTPKHEMGLYKDHSCDASNFPSVSSHIFTDHQDEVWYLAFSNKGDRLASSSKDATAIIFDINSKKKLHVLSGHQEAVAFLSWSPDDSKLLTCSNDTCLCLWDTKTGERILYITTHTSAVTSCGWLPDNERFVSGSLDKLLILWNIKGVILHQWTGSRVNDLRISADGTRMLACTNDKIKIYDMNTFKELGQMEEPESITSISISKNGKYAIANTATQEIHLWDISSTRLVRKYVGHKQGKFVIRSGFGGIQESFLASGSEDAKVYIWHQKSGHLVSVLSGHSSTVNAVSWNPAEPQTLATCSDDKTIRIWTPAASTSLSVSEFNSSSKN